MSLGWVITGSIFEACLALFLFMLVAFSGAGLANGGGISQFHLTLLNSSLFLLPAFCLVCAAIVIYLYNTGGGSHSYWWYAAPIALTAVYFAYVARISSS